MAQRDSLKDAAYEAAIFRSRTIVALAFVFVAFVLVGIRYGYLQIYQYASYSTLSDKNRLQVMPIPPTRGLIYDRYGVLLAENIPSYRLVLVKEHIGDVESTLDQISKLITLTESQRQRFYKNLRQPRRPFEPVTVKSQLTEDEIAQIAVNLYKLDGVDVEAHLVRHYPFGASLAHVIGYVGSINQRDKKRIDPLRYQATKQIGKIGVEEFYEDYLLGEVGSREVETTAQGRILRVINENSPKPGANITLHIDSHLQVIAEKAFGDRRGALVAIDTQTGGILAMVSTPSFDANLFVNGISNTEYSKLRDNLDLPLLNRAVRGEYPPGSVMKPLMGLLGVHKKINTWEKTIQDRGWYQLKNDERIYRDWKRRGHGVVDMHRAIVESCDIYFYDLAFNLGIDEISPFLKNFGFGSRTVVDIPNQRPGLMPSKEWKQQMKKRAWYPGDTLNIGIGQGDMLVTPMQLAGSMAMLANKGKWQRPRLLKDTTNPAIEVDLELRANQLIFPDIKLNDPLDWDRMLDAMQDVVHSKKGTAQIVGQNAAYNIAGKTGTAQVVSIKQNEEYDSEALGERNRDHALFVGIAPRNLPRIAVAAIVENGEKAGSTAGVIVRKVMDAYLLDPRNNVEGVH